VAADTYHDLIWQDLPPGRPGPNFADRLSFLLANLKGGERVLDLGCGEGFFLAELVDRGHRAVGADVAAVALERAARRRPDLKVVHLKEGREWPFEVAAFDAVWCSEVFEHVLDTQTFLSELRRVLRSGGVVLITTPNCSRLELLGCALSARRFASRFDPLSDHIRFFNRRSLRALLERFGFEGVEFADGQARGTGLLFAKALRSRF